MLKRIRQFRAIQLRKKSTASSPYDNYTKLRAFPFHIHPKLALRLLAPYASVACNFKKMWPSLGALALPFLNFDFLRPARFSAFYFPAWFVTGEVEANVTYKGVQSKESAWFNNTYIPGSHIAVLSAAPLGSSSFMKSATVPFNSLLLHQHGEPVECIPFSTSPFSVFDVAASHPPSRSITINEDLSIVPSSVKPDLISACPVLLPLYLAQYENENKEGNDSSNGMFTFILRAYGGSGFDVVMCENLSKISKESRDGLELLNKLTGHESSSEVHTFIPGRPRVSIPNISMNKDISDSFSEWLEELQCSSSNLEVLAKSSLGVIGKGDEDLRIREMASVGTSLEGYKKVTAAVLDFKKSLNVVIGYERDAVEQTSKDTFSKARKLLEEKVKSLEAERVQIAPTWWLEWSALNRPESQKNTVQSGDDENAAGTLPPKDSDKVD